MKKQILLASALAAVFILAAAGASFAGDAHGAYRGHRFWKDKRFDAKPYSHHWKRSPVPRRHQEQRYGRYPVPRRQWNARSPYHRPGYRTPRPQFGHRPDGRHDGRPQVFNHRPPMNSSYRSSAGERHDTGTSGARYGRDQADRSGASADTTTVAQEGNSARRQGRPDGARTHQF
jgi:hypothetical protein